jgi:hypothetical protein
LARYKARKDERKALTLWLKGAIFAQIAEAGCGFTTPSGAWRAVYRVLGDIPRTAAEDARQAQLLRLQDLRLLLWNQTRSDPIRAAEALIKLEAREARLLGLDEPEQLEVETVADWRKRNREEQLNWIRLMTREERAEYLALFERLKSRAANADSNSHGPDEGYTKPPSIFEVEKAGPGAAYLPRPDQGKNA